MAPHLILFAIAVVLLIRSMTKHLKRVPPSFDAADDTAEPAAPAEAETADAKDAPRIGPGGSRGERGPGARNEQPGPR